MVNGKKLILTGFNVPKNAREFLVSMRQNICKMGIPVKEAVNSFELCTPRVYIRVIINDPTYIRPSLVTGADVIFNVPWLRNFVRNMGLESPNVIYTESIEFAHRYIEACNTDVAIYPDFVPQTYLDGTEKIAGLAQHINLVEDALRARRAWKNRKKAESQRPEIRKVHFSGPVTCVIWSDGTETLVRCKEGEQLDPEKGLAMAIAKKFLGTNKSGSNYYDVFKQWLPKHSTADHKDGDGGFIEVAFVEVPTRDNKKSDAEDAVETNPDNPSRGMTCREKLALEYPENVNEQFSGGCFGCPSDYGYLPKPDGCYRVGVRTRSCKSCWDRVIPGTSVEGESK